MKRNPELSAEEIISYLKHTNLPTILVEGTADAYVYRWLEEKLSTAGDVLPCSGREVLLNIFDRCVEYPNARVAFVADKDMWHFSPIPDKYKDIVIFTDGYSIENDLYAKDVIERLLSREEKEAFERLLNEIIIWFSFEVDCHLKTGASNCGIHINRVCPEEEICEKFKQTRGFSTPDRNLVAHIKGEYDRNLRGKTLFETLLRFLSHPNRQSKYSKFNLMEIGAKLDNAKITRLASAIDDRLVTA